VSKMVSKEKRDGAVEGDGTRYHYACTHGVWTTFGRQKARKEHLERLKDMERMMQHHVRTRAAVPPRTPVERGRDWLYRVRWRRSGSGAVKALTLGPVYT